MHAAVPAPPPRLLSKAAAGEGRKAWRDRSVTRSRCPGACAQRPLATHLVPSAGSGRRGGGWKTQRRRGRRRGPPARPGAPSPSLAQGPGCAAGSARCATGTRTPQKSVCEKQDSEAFLTAKRCAPSSAGARLCRCIRRSGMGGGAAQRWTDSHPCDAASHAWTLTSTAQHSTAQHGTAQHGVHGALACLSGTAGTPQTRAAAPLRAPCASRRRAGAARRRPPRPPPPQTPAQCQTGPRGRSAPL